MSVHTAAGLAARGLRVGLIDTDIARLMNLSVGTVWNYENREM